MVLKVGDIVYCIDNYGVNNSNLYDDIPYIIIGFGQFGGLIINNLSVVDVPYRRDRFISEKEYQISKRKEKIIKLKDGIRCRRYNLLY